MKQNKYRQIYQELAEKIENETYQINDILPSEHELAAHYATSRETIRKALTLLSQNGYIQKLRGKGSLVLGVSKMSFPLSGLVSFKELQASLGKTSETVVHEFSSIKLNNWLAEQLQSAPKEKAWRIMRCRRIDGESVILDKDYFLKEYVPNLTKKIAEGSIYEYLEKKKDLPISYAKKEIVVEPCTDEDRKYLDLKGYDHVVVVKNFVFLTDTTQFQYTESRHRLDKFRFIDFARRKH